MKVRVYRRPKPAVWWRKVLRFLVEFLTTILEGVILALIIKWLGL